jgi:hypothetical protein
MATFIVRTFQMTALTGRRGRPEIVRKPPGIHRD